MFWFNCNICFWTDDDLNFKVRIFNQDWKVPLMVWKFPGSIKPQTWSLFIKPYKKIMKTIGLGCCKIRFSTNIWSYFLKRLILYLEEINKCYTKIFGFKGKILLLCCFLFLHKCTMKSTILRKLLALFMLWPKPSVVPNMKSFKLNYKIRTFWRNP